jgi:hypothetical protein
MRLPTVGVARIPHRSRSPRACHHDMISSLVCHPLLFYRSHQWIDSFSPFPAERRRPPLSRSSTGARPFSSCRAPHPNLTPPTASPLDPAGVSRLVARANAAISRIAATRLYCRLLLNKKMSTEREEDEPK